MGLRPDGDTLNGRRLSSPVFGKFEDMGIDEWQWVALGLISLRLLQISYDNNRKKFDHS